MDNLISKKNILIFLLLAIIAVAIPVSLKLVQNQTQLKSKAAETCLATTNICQGYSTYTTCVDDFGYKNGTERFCRPDSGGGTTFRCYDASNPANCLSAPDGTYNYSCSSCPNLASASEQTTPTSPSQPATPPQTSTGLPTGSTSGSGGTVCTESYDGRTLSQESSEAQSAYAGNEALWIQDHNKDIVNKNPGVPACDKQILWTQLCPAIYQYVRYGGGEALAPGKWATDHDNDPKIHNCSTPEAPPTGGIPPGGSCPVGTTYTISGAVRDSGNLVRSRDIKACLDPPPNSCTSDAVALTDGTYSIPNVRPGGAHNVYIDVSKVSGQYQQPEAKLVDKEVTNCSTNLTVDFILQKNSCPVGSTFTISGKVTNNNQPIAGAKVCLDPITDGTCNDKTAFTTDSSGNYTIPGVVPGDPSKGYQGHNVYLAADSLGTVVAPANIATQLVGPSICANTPINFALGSQAASGLKTKCYILSEDTAAVNAVTSCNDPLAAPYTGQVTLPQVFTASTTAVTKTFSVKFINTAGVASPVSSKSITYNPAAVASTTPTITNVNCQQNAITITGTNFGNQGTGRVTANSQPTTVGTWNSASNTITAIPTQLLDGNVPIVVTLGNNQTVSGQCTVNTTTVAFTAVNSCRQPGNFAAENVSAKIYDVTSTDANGTPLVERTISLDKNGKPVNFAPKLSQGKQYTLIVKAPNTVARAKTFTPTGGTYNLPVIILPAGDIYPLVAPDGHINQFDINELKHQWSIGADVSRLADLNDDSRVNSIDYSCAINNNTLKDDFFTPATLPTAAASTTASASPTITTITPVNALISTAITITGVNFGAVTTGTVNFYAVSVTSPTATAGVNSWTDTQITATVPGALTPSTQYSIEVVTAAGVKSAKTNYFVGP